ncbi:MAG: hypothetical protein ACTSP6_01335 [Promethearchaeota archaeon]
MLLQLSPTGEIVLALIIMSIIALLVFLIGVFVTKWYAKKKGWEASLKTAVVVNLVWTILFFLIGLIFNIFFGEFGLTASIAILVINSLVGAVIVSKFYDKEFGESFMFTLVVQVILFLIALLLGFIFGITLGLVLIGLLLSL